MSHLPHLMSFHLCHLHLFYYPLLHQSFIQNLKLSCFVSNFSLSLFLYTSNWFHGFLDLALIGFCLFLVSLFVSFPFWPHAVGKAGYLSVFEHAKHYRIASYWYWLFIYVMHRCSYFICKWRTTNCFWWWWWWWCGWWPTRFLHCLPSNLELSATTLDRHVGEVGGGVTLHFLPSFPFPFPFLPYFPFLVLLFLFHRTVYRHHHSTLCMWEDVTLALYKLFLLTYLLSFPSLPSA